LLLGGSGDLAGTTFTISAGSLADAHVEAGQVIVLTGSITGCFPIVSVDSDTTLTLSVLYDGLYPDTGPDVPSPVGSASGLTYAIRTFGPQRRIVTDLLKSAAGVGPGTRRPDASIVNETALKRACVLGTLHMVYNALAASSGDPSALVVRAELYRKLYRRALERGRVEIDTNADGEGDLAIMLGAGELRRY
jgi:hypothetical protein